jgi:glycosyltransferase involved in cell wall biosynthesis
VLERVELWICTVSNPLELKKFIARVHEYDNQKKNPVISIRFIYNGVDINRIELQNIAENLRREFPDTLIEVDLSPQLSLSDARNYAINFSDADWGIFLDDDTQIDGDFCNNLVVAIQDAAKRECVIVGGKICLSGVPSNLHPIHATFLSGLDYGDPDRVLRKEFVNGACFGLNRKWILDNTDLFSNQLGRKGSLLLSGEESLLISKVRSLGGSIWYANSLVVQHEVDFDRLTPNWLLKRLAWEAVTDSVIREILEKASKSKVSIMENALPTSEQVNIFLELRTLFTYALSGNFEKFENYRSFNRRSSNRIKLRNILGKVKSFFDKGRM